MCYDRIQYPSDSRHELEDILQSFQDGQGMGATASDRLWFQGNFTNDWFQYLGNLASCQGQSEPASTPVDGREELLDTAGGPETSTRTPRQVKLKNSAKSTTKNTVAQQIHIVHRYFFWCEKRKNTRGEGSCVSWKLHSTLISWEIIGAATFTITDVTRSVLVCMALESLKELGWNCHGWTCYIWMHLNHLGASKSYHAEHQ